PSAKTGQERYEEEGLAVIPRESVLFGDTVAIFIYRCLGERLHPLVEGFGYLLDQLAIVHPGEEGANLIGDHQGAALVADEPRIGELVEKLGAEERVERHRDLGEVENACVVGRTVDEVGPAPAHGRHDVEVAQLLGFAVESLDEDVRVLAIVFGDGPFEERAFLRAFFVPDADANAVIGGGATSGECQHDREQQKREEVAEHRWWLPVAGCWLLGGHGRWPSASKRTCNTI